MPKIDLKFVCTLKCNRFGRDPQCTRACYQQPLIQSNPLYQATIEDVTLLLQSAENFHSVLLTGGEPLLWDNLEIACLVFHTAVLNGKINRFAIITNGTNPDRLIKLKDLLTSVYLTKYPDNGAAVEKIQKAFGDKVQVWEREQMMPPRKEPISDEQNKIFGCRCVGVLYYDKKIYSCSMIPAMITAHGQDVVNEKAMAEPKMGFMDKLGWHQKACRYCISNSAVRRSK